MCFAKRDLIIMGVKMAGYDKSLILELAATPNRKEYNNFFTLERVIGPGESEVVASIFFDDVIDIVCDRPAGEYCTLSFILNGGDERLAHLRVSKASFNSFDLNKMIKICKQSKAPHAQKKA